MKSVGKWGKEDLDGNTVRRSQPKDKFDENKKYLEDIEFVSKINHQRK